MGLLPEDEVSMGFGAYVVMELWKGSPPPIFYLSAGADVVDTSSYSPDGPDSSTSLATSVLASTCDAPSSNKQTSFFQEDQTDQLVLRVILNSKPFAASDVGACSNGTLLEKVDDGREKVLGLLNVAQARELIVRYNAAFASKGIHIPHMSTDDLF